MKGTVALISHGSPEYGNGHQIRSLELKKTLLRAQIDVSYHSFSDLNLDLNTDYLKKFSAVVVDLPFSLQKTLSNRLENIKFIALDWVEEETIPDVNIAPYKHDEFQYLAHETILSGEQYVIIPQFGIGESDKKDVDVTIMLGAFPKADNLELAIKLGLEIGDQVVCIGNIKSTDIRKNKVRYMGFMENPLEIVGRSTYTISNAGISLLQSLSVGAITLAWPQNSWEKGYFDNFICKNLLIPEVYEDCGNLVLKGEHMSHTAKFKKIFDGYGANRIADLIVNYFGLKG